MKQKLFLPLTLISLSCMAATPDASPKNIIFMIGDGMGSAQTTAYRYYSDNPETKVVESTIFDQLLVGTASTYPDDKTYVTDSAASATALSTGVKSYNGAIGVGVNKQPLETILEYARKRGKGTGIIASSQINHATPASFMAHNESRKNYNQIADSYVDELIKGKVKADLMLGGGTSYFKRQDRDLIKELNQYGFNYIDQLEQLDSLKRLPVIGLFAPVGLPYAIDHQKPNRVTAMTRAALPLLAEEFEQQGFFIMIEGSQVDWCAHANDIACAMAEMDDFAKAIQLAKEFVDSNPDTLLLITADHSTGGLSVGGRNVYEWRTEKVKQIKTSVQEISTAFVALASQSPNEVMIKNAWREFVKFPLSAKHINALQQAFTKANKSGGKWPEMSQKVVTQAILDIINDETKTGWTTNGHSADDVQVFAYGTGSEQFAGFQDNTDIAKKLFRLLGKNSLF